jgi:O-methyltransferase involved in polyketide biosynthesis
MIHHRETISGPYTETSQSMFSFIRSNTEKESIIVFLKPRLMRMMTDRKSLMLTKKEDLSRGDYLCLYPPTQLKVLAAQLRDQVSPDTMQDLLKQEGALLIYENSEFQVYKLTYSKIPFLNR